MIVLDTNVLSELTREAPSDRVCAWFRAVESREQLAVSTMSLAELHDGISRHPDGARRDALWKKIFGQFLAAMAPKVLPFGEDDAPYYSRIRQTARAAGEQLSTADTIIASNVLSNAALLATRDRQLLRLRDLQTVNPWD